MKSVAANALLVELLGKRVAVGDFGMAAMKGRVEAGDLRQLRLPLQQGADGAEIVRLMERRERREGLEPLENGIVDEDRGAIVGAAMNHAMTDRDGQASDLCAQELHDLAECCRHVAASAAGQVLSMRTSPFAPLATRCGWTPMPSICPLSRRCS